MDLQEQLAFFDEYADDAYDRALEAFTMDREAIIAAARRRLAGGYPIYGMTGWLWKRWKLLKNRREEFADSLNYTVMLFFREGR